MDKYMECFHNQDEAMENIMLFSPMPVLQAIQDAYHESVLADMNAEDAEIFGESVPVRKSGKLSCKERARRHRKANRTHALRDRYHGKKGEEYRYAEGACRDMRLYNNGLVYDRNIRQERLETARINSALDISPIERLTASVIAAVNRTPGNYLGYSWDVWNLVEAYHREYQYDLPDYAYVQKTNKGRIILTLEYENWGEGVNDSYYYNTNIDLA